MHTTAVRRFEGSEVPRLVRRFGGWFGGRFGTLLVLLLGSAATADAQIGVGSWTRTDATGKGITMTVEVCCNGGRRLTYHIPAMGNQPATTMTVDSPMDGTEVPTLIGGKPTGQTMAIRRVDDRHVTAIVRMGGQPFGTSSATLSADGRTMTVESVTQSAGVTQKVIETWVLK